MADQFFIVGGRTPIKVPDDQVQSVLSRLSLEGKRAQPAEPLYVGESYYVVPKKTEADEDYDPTKGMQPPPRTAFELKLKAEGKAFQTQEEYMRERYRELDPMDQARRADARQGARGAGGNMIPASERLRAILGRPPITPPAPAADESTPGSRAVVELLNDPIAFPNGVIQGDPSIFDRPGVTPPPAPANAAEPPAPGRSSSSTKNLGTVPAFSRTGPMGEPLPEMPANFGAGAAKTFGLEAVENAGPMATAVLGAQGGGALGTAIMPGPGTAVGALLGALGGGVAGGIAQRKAQEAAVGKEFMQKNYDPMRAKLRKENPVAATAGIVAPQIIGFSPKSLGTIARELSAIRGVKAAEFATNPQAQKALAGIADSLVGAGFGAGAELAAQIKTGDYSGLRVAAQAAANAIYTDPRFKSNPQAKAVASELNSTAGGMVFDRQPTPSAPGKVTTAPDGSQQVTLVAKEPLSEIVTPEALPPKPAADGQMRQPVAQQEPATPAPLTQARPQQPAAIETPPPAIKPALARSEPAAVPVEATPPAPRHAQPLERPPASPEGQLPAARKPAEPATPGGTVVADSPPAPAPAPPRPDVAPVNAPPAKPKRGGYRPMSEESRQNNPIAALVEDGGGIRPYARAADDTRPYLKEHYESVPMRYRARKGGGGRAPDQMLEDAQRAGLLPPDATVEDLTAALRGSKRTMTEKQYWDAKQAEAKAIEDRTEVARPENLAVGDTYTENGESFRVLEETDTALRVKDGREYWIRFDETDGVRIDKGSLRGQDGKAKKIEAVTDAVDEFSPQAEAPSDAPTSKFPPRPENATMFKRQPLSDYGPEMHRQMSQRELEQIVSRSGGDETIMVANVPELALSQGSSDNVTVVFDASRLTGTPNTNKPGWEAMYDSGATEFYARTGGQSERSRYIDAIKSITTKPLDLSKTELDPSTKAEEGWNRSLGGSNTARRLEREGFTAARNSDGSVTWTRGRAPESPAKPAAEKPPAPAAKAAPGAPAAKPAAPTTTAEPMTVAKYLDTTTTGVKLKLPTDGAGNKATHLRITDAQGRTSDVTIDDVQRGENALAGTGVAKVQAVRKVGKSETVLPGKVEIKPAKLAERATGALDRMEQEARDEIKRLRSGGTAGLNKPVGIASNYVAIGAIKIAKGAVRYAEFAKQMVDEFGETIRPLLREIYASSRKLAGALYETDDAFRAASSKEGGKVARAAASRNLSLISDDPTSRRSFQALDAAMEAKGEPQPQTVKQWDAEAERIYTDKGGAKVYNEMVGGKLDIANPVNQRLAKLVMDRDAAADLRSGDVQRIERATTAMWNMRGQRTEYARALMAGRDPSATPAERMRSIIRNMLLAPTDADVAAGVIANDARQRSAIQRSARKMVKLIDYFKKMGIDITNLSDADLATPKKLAAILREVQASKATLADREMEWWRNAILSAPSTHVVNMLGNTANGFYEYALLRPTQAALNLLTGNSVKGATTMGDVGSIYDAMFSGGTWKRSWRNAVDAFVNEQPVTGGMRIEEKGAAIPGMAGQIIRTPQRLLLAGDELAKTTTSQIEVVAAARRIAREKGLKGDELARFIDEQVSDPASNAWGEALDQAKRLSFQTEAGYIARLVLQGRAQQNFFGWTLRHIMPFVTTPANIIKTGFKRTPLGLPFAVRDVARAVKGTGSSEAASRAVAEQVLAAGTAAIVYSIANDKDEDGLPKWITGSSPRSSQQRDFMWRTIPPQHIRVPGTDKWVSYQRIEPMATSLSVMVDLMHDDGKEFPERGWNTITGLVRDKTFMQGLSDIVEWFDQGERGIEKANRWSANFAASYMPNVIRSTLRASDPIVRKRMVGEPGAQWIEDWAKRAGQSALPHPVFMPPAKVDIFGRDIEKDSPTGGPTTDFIYRALVPINVREQPSLTLIDRWLVAYNAKHEDKPYFPQNPPAKIGDKQLTEAQYHEFLRLRGAEVVRRMQAGRIRIDPENVKENDREKLEQVFREATQDARRKMKL